jgi:hypothetical protein
VVVVSAVVIVVDIDINIAVDVPAGCAWLTWAIRSEPGIVNYLWSSRLESRSALRWTDSGLKCTLAQRADGAECRRILTHQPPSWRCPMNRGADLLWDRSRRPGISAPAASGRSPMRPKSDGHAMNR